MEMNYDDAELHQIEEELGTEILPGTEIMTDVGQHHFVKSRAGVLVPQPSDDPHDPLNWSWWWKTLTMIAATSVTFVQGFGPLALGPAFPAYMEEFNTSLPSVVKFTGVAILILGFSNFIWVPLSTSFGRRGVYICSNLITFGSMIWRAKATSYNSFMGACILNGIGAGPAESIQPAVIADIYFLHDRGFWNTFYWFWYIGSLILAPIIDGAMTQHFGSWRPFWWLNTGLVGLSLLLVVFCFPETKWHRLHPNELARRAENKHQSGTAPGTSHEKDVNAEERIDSYDANKNNDLSPQATAARDPFLGRGYPSKKQFLLFQPNAHPLRSIFLDLWLPWKLFAFPIVELAAFIVSWACSGYLTLNLTQSQVFASPPYNFGPGKIGNFNVAILIGAFIGLATAGPFSDWVAKRLTIRNRGIREPEMRLAAMVPYAVVMYIGSIVVAVGYQQKWRWPVIVVVGYTCLGISTTALPAISSTYAVDSYKPVAGSVFVAITVNKNVWGYGYSEYLNSWIEEVGYITPILVNASLILLFCLCAIVFFFYGKTFRRWTAKSNVHKM